MFGPNNMNRLWKPYMSVEKKKHEAFATVQDYPDSLFEADRLGFPIGHRVRRRIIRIAEAEGQIADIKARRDGEPSKGETE